MCSLSKMWAGEPVCKRALKRQAGDTIMRISTRQRLQTHFLIPKMLQQHLMPVVGLKFLAKYEVFWTCM